METAGATPQAILRSDALHECSVALPAASHFRGCSSPYSPVDSHEPAGLNLTMSVTLYLYIYVVLLDVVPPEVPMCSDAAQGGRGLYVVGVSALRCCAPSVAMVSYLATTRAGSLLPAR